MIAPGRLAGRSRWLALPIAGAAVVAAALAFAPGGLGPIAARAGLVAAALAAAAVLARRRVAPPATTALALVSRASLGRDAGVALVEVDGRRLVVGYGPSGVQLLAESRRASPEGSAP